MKENLTKIINNAYSPYSEFRVAAIVKMQNGQEFIGVNVENASFKNGLCAEQVAISAAVAEGYDEKDFAQIHIMGDSDQFTYPCFLCRQLLVEFFSPDAKVFCYNKKGKAKEFIVSDLCPHPFDTTEVKNGK